MILDNNRITLRKSNNNSFIFYSTNPLFEPNQDYVFEFDDWGFGFRIPNIDEDGNCTTVKANKNGCTITLSEVEVPTDYYHITESNEDEVRVEF